MRVLFDTNIIIGREDHKILNEDLQNLLRIINKLKIEIVLHPKCIEDIKRDKDSSRKDIILSKFKTYQILVTYPKPQRKSDFVRIIGEPTRVNDEIDNFLLYALFRNAVNFLITEDMGIHKKAKKLILSDRVLSIIEALDLFRKEVPVDVKTPPALQKSTMSNLDVKDPIFDTLRGEYQGFDEWFAKKASSGRDCWIYQMTDGSLGAVLIYKFEQELIPSTPVLPKEKRLKISTMKVSHVGYKIGELLLKLSFDLAIKNNIPEIYLTYFTKNGDFLLDLIKEYGFKKTSVINHEWTEIPEAVYVKQILIDEREVIGLSAFEISKFFYPNFYDGVNVKKFIIPIQPQYYDRLFTDYPNRQIKIDEYFGRFIIEGNTIKKAYLSHSSTRQMEKGAILLFYRSEDFKSLVSLGVIESVYYNLTNPEEIISLVGKRSVYSLSEIKEITHSPTTVILFNHHLHFKKPIKYKSLLKHKILNGPCQSITKINHEQYLIIKEEGDVDERFTFN